MSEEQDLGNLPEEGSYEQNQASGTDTVPPPEEEMDMQLNSEIEEQGVPEGIQGTGAAIGASAEQLEEDEEAENEGLAIGDRVRILTTKYGETRGTVYYLDPENLIRVLPDGITNQVRDFPLVDGDLDPDLGKSSIELLAIGPRAGFIEFLGIRTEQQLDSFLPDGSLGEPYKVKSINIEQDSIEIEDTTGATRRVAFEGIGIPTDENFRVLQVHSFADIDEEEEEVTPQQVQQISAEVNQEQKEEEDAEDTFEEDLFETIGTFAVPQFQEVLEVPSTERVYDEITQKGSLLDDLFSLLDVTSQRNPVALKRISTFIELVSFLKNSVVSRGVDGVPIGQEQISLETLNDVLKNRNVPIARPILETKRVLLPSSKRPKGFFDRKKSKSVLNVDQFENEQFLSRDLIEFTEEGNTYLQTSGGLQSGEIGVGVPRFYQVQTGYIRNFPFGDKYGYTGYKFAADGEFFRTDAPGDKRVLGLVPPIDANNEESVMENLREFLKPIEFSLRRGHGPTHRPLEKGGVDIAVSGDSAPINGYILFPYRAVLKGAIGATRSGKLWETISRTFSEKISMKTLLEMLDGVTTEKDAQRILHFSSSNPIATAVPFSEYLKLILKSLVPRGPGDLTPMKYDLGIQDKEPNLEQQTVINDRIKEVISSLRQMIRGLREESSKPGPKAINNSILSPDLVKSIDELVISQPLLSNLLKELAARTPNYKNVDIAVVAYFMRYAPDYFLATLSGDPVAIQRERFRFLQSQAIEVLRAANRLEELERTKGSEPELNPCAHVAELNTIRKVEDDKQRFELLAKLLSSFKGEVEDNWVNCLSCKKHLLCRHEELQIQQFLHPLEYDVIQKQIIYNFAGETDDTNYICRQCGLPIAEMDFDKNIEFDDNGQPLMGRSVLVDKDAAREEAIRELFGVPLEEQSELRFDTDAKNEFYKIFKVLMDEVGIDVVGEDLLHLLERAEAFMKTEKSEAEYIAAHRGKKAISYAQYISQIKIGLATALLLIEIQSHVPDYVVKFVVPGCRPGFGGYPREADANPEDAEKSVGIQYFACAVSGIFRQDYPWVNGFQWISNQELRKKAVTKIIINRLDRIVKDITIQGLLERKRRYLREVFGAAALKGRPSEKLPSGFLPRMEHEADAKEAAATSPTITEGVHGAMGEVLKADTWIRAANELARKSAVIVKNSPLAETSCCFDKVTEPGEFFKVSQQSLPQLPQYFTLSPGFKYQSILYTPIEPRALQTFSATPSLGEAFRVLLQICYKGSHIGLPHELGYDNKCDWCGLEILPSIQYTDYDTSGNILINEEKIRMSFTNQGVELNEQMFQDLLDAAHKRTEFMMYVTPPITSSEQVLETIETLEYPPTTDFMEIVERVKADLVNLGKAEHTEPEIQSILSPMRESISPYEELILRYYGKADNQNSGYAVLQTLLKEPPQAIFGVLRSQFLIPAERLLSAYDRTSNLNVPGYYKLAESHVTLLDTMITDHTNYLEEFSLWNDEEEDETSLVKARYKLNAFVEKLSSILQYAGELRLSRMMFDTKLSPLQVKLFFQEFLRILVFGPLGELIDPSINPTLPEGEEMSADPGRSDSFIFKFVANCLTRFVKERLPYSPAIVKQRVEAAREAEKNQFLKRMDKLSDTDRKLDIQMQKIGAGEWAVGGTKAIYSYDADHWEKMRTMLAANYDAASSYSPYGEIPLVAFQEPLDPTGYEGELDTGQGYDNGDQDDE